MINVIYNPAYNIDLGLLNYLHPFDGTKFRKIVGDLQTSSDIRLVDPQAPMAMELIDEFLSSVMYYRVRDRRGIFKAIEVPAIPLITFSYVDKKILTPMRWGVAGTLLGATRALAENAVYWNLAGGYHHAMQRNMEGFCIYNDIGITHQQLVKQGKLAADDPILIIDTDAHHGNGNAYTFMDDRHVTLLDVYNVGIYPTSGYSRDRVDIPVPLVPGTEGEEYLERLDAALAQLEGDYKLAFVVAGTDVLVSDKLGGLGLTIDDVAEREKRTLEALRSRNIPTVLLGGGGYSKDSAHSVAAAIRTCSASAACS